MLKQIIKNLLLYFKNKKKGVVSYTPYISLKTSIGTNTTIENNSQIDEYTNIGENVYIGRNCYLTKVDIGNYCSIANNVSIGQGEHNLDNISTSSLFYNEAYSELTKKDCILGNDVWIGVDSIILRGVTIGNGAVVGANSVVTKDVPPYAIVVGSPATVIKFRFDENTINQIEKSQWWELDLESAKEAIKNLEKKINEGISSLYRYDKTK